MNELNKMYVFEKPYRINLFLFENICYLMRYSSMSSGIHHQCYDHWIHGGDSEWQHGSSYVYR